MAAGAVVLAVWLVATMPKPVPVLGGEAWQTYARDSQTLRTGPPTSIVPLMLEVAAWVAGLLGCSWLILHGIRRRRGLFWNEMPDESLPPQR